MHYSGTKGRNKGEFTNLQGVAASSNGRILIADSNNQCVQVWPVSEKLQGSLKKPKFVLVKQCIYVQIFTNEGEFKSRFGVRGRSPGQLQRPTGVAVHPSGDIIIADYDNKWVSIFSCEGKFKVCVLICLELKGYCTLLRANAHSNVFCVVDLCSNLIVCICCSPGKTWLRKTHGTKGRVCGPKRSCYCG